MPICKCHPSHVYLLPYKSSKVIPIYYTSPRNHIQTKKFSPTFTYCKKSYSIQILQRKSELLVKGVLATQDCFPIQHTSPRQHFKTKIFSVCVFF